MTASGPASDEIPLDSIRAKVVSVEVDGVVRTKNDVIMDTVQDLFKVEDFQDLVLTSQNVRGKLQDLGCFSNVAIHIDTSSTGIKDYVVTYQVKKEFKSFTISKSIVEPLQFLSSLFILN